MELIVTVTIILVVSILGVVNYQAINKKSRDERRLSDIKIVQLALESYRQTVGRYPNSLDLLLSNEYIQKIPTDPKNYSYLYENPTSLSYYLYARMEDVGSTNGNFSDKNCTESCNYRAVNP